MRTANVIEAIAAEAELFTSLRRDIHAHPELAFQEQRTSELIAKTLTDWGIPIHRGIGKTGVVGVIKSGSSKRAIGLRADFDALPIAEQNTFPHASVNSGIMHACGHDGHTAMLLAAAKYFSRQRNFDGTVYLIFQPAEEAGGGAHQMIQEGLFDRFPMTAIFGAHNMPGLPAGKFAVRSGPVLASSSDFKIEVLGKGTHAATPHKGIDPIPVASHIVQAFQSVLTRNKNPLDTGLISVTSIHAGHANNVIPDSCELRGTVRTFTLEVLDMIERRMREIVEGTCQVFGAKSTFDFQRCYPPTVNHPRETDFVRGVLESFVGESNVQSFDPQMGAEDFSFFLQVKPGCYFLIGNGDGESAAEGRGAGLCTLHSSSYDFNDQLIPLGGSFWVRLAEAWFASPELGS